MFSWDTDAQVWWSPEQPATSKEVIFLFFSFPFWSGLHVWRCHWRHCKEEKKSSYTQVQRVNQLEIWGEPINSIVKILIHLLNQKTGKKGFQFPSDVINVFSSFKFSYKVYRKFYSQQRKDGFSQESIIWQQKWTFSNFTLSQVNLQKKNSPCNPVEHTLNLIQRTCLLTFSQHR